jgi:hypothetical protein
MKERFDEQLVGVMKCREVGSKSWSRIGELRHCGDVGG